MNAVSESILQIKTMWENFCDNSSLNHFYFYCLLIGLFNGLLIQFMYNGFFNGLYYTCTWPYNGVIYGNPKGSIALWVGQVEKNP